MVMSDVRKISLLLLLRRKLTLKRSKSWTSSFTLMMVVAVVWADVQTLAEEAAQEVKDKTDVQDHNAITLKSHMEEKVESNVKDVLLVNVDHVSRIIVAVTITVMDMMF